MHFQPRPQLGFVWFCLQVERNYVKGPIEKLMFVNTKKFFEKEHIALPDNKAYYKITIIKIVWNWNRNRQGN